MKTKSNSPTRLGKVATSPWKVSGTPVTIDEFIDRGSGCVDASEFCAALGSLNGRLREKLELASA